MNQTPHAPHHPARRGFTLFEVGISLVIVSVGVLSVMMLMPVGIKAQQMARFQLLASAKAIEIMSVNANQWRKWDLQRMEGRTLGLCSINQVAQTPLIEQKMCNWRHGSLPVPMEIARRLDSDGDEIQNILAQGGYLFYSSPRPIASDDEDDPNAIPRLEDREIPNESQRLVYAIVGHPQQLALASHPCKAWPYYDWYPNPPRSRTTADTSSPNSRHEDSWRLNAWPNLNDFLAVKQAWQDAQIAPPPPPDPPAPAAPLTPVERDLAIRELTKEKVITYRDKAKELAVALGMTVDAISGIPDLPPGSAYDPVDASKVLAAGYVAQAMVWLTSPSLWPPPPLPLTPAQLAELDEARTNARKAHESALTWLRRHTTTDPYNWGIDRALNFQNGWDQPLLQYELFASADPAAVWASPFTVPTLGDVSWRVISAQPVVNAGTSSSDKITSTRLTGNQTEIASSWGNADTFNLTKPFQPAERCRQMVFWAVDWKSYADAETAPSAPQDASRTPYDSNNTMAYNAGAHKFNNPERFFTFENETRTTFANKTGNNATERGIYLGLWGADRNGNRRLDIGPVPTSVRMRAMSVARFNVYQPRVWSGLRN